MNRIIDEFRRDDERILDRLVDGELTEDDRKALLGALDDEPGAWRRCALAFLEAQSWRGHFGVLRGEPKSTAAVSTVQPVAEPVVARAAAVAAPKPSRFFEMCLAVAASVVMAFGFGAWYRGSSNGPPSNPMPMANSNRPSLVAPQTVVGSHTPWHRAKLKYDDPATRGADEIDLPVVESQNLTEDWLRQHQSAMPADVQKALEQSGHRVIKRQQLVPIELKDGKRLIVPVEQVDVVPGRRPAY